MGRKNNYLDLVEPRLKDIEKWVQNDMSDDNIAKNLGISLRSLYEYKGKYPQLSQIYTRARAKMVEDVKSALLKKALGFEYKEEKRTARKDKNGETIVFVEEYKKYSPPSETAAAMLLRNYDKTWTDADNATVRLRKEAQDLKKAIAEATNFDLNIGDNENE